jgi:UDP-N-acetylglucosamine 4-epimerase
MREFERKLQFLESNQRKWCVTGAAGFIGSNLIEFLLGHNQYVVGLDNFATGHRHNLDQVQQIVSNEQWENFSFIDGDIRDLATCLRACDSVDFVLHQAALGSVPRSIEDPLITNEVNVGGFLNMLTAGRDHRVESFVYAASSSTYGDSPGLPKQEDIIGNPLSPYAVTKYVNELYASVFQTCYEFKATGLRYFNIFGQRQDPEGAYAAVIPKWVASMLKGEQVYINGKGDTSRDFCFIDNAVEANILAALTDNPAASGQVYNVALNDQTSLVDLHTAIRKAIEDRLPDLQIKEPEFRDYRAGDVLHSRANIAKARDLLGYDPKFRVEKGLEISMDWYIQDLNN